jgi:hypothetical protein
MRRLAAGAIGTALALALVTGLAGAQDKYVMGMAGGT